jgi:hypothetical protein
MRTFNAQDLERLERRFLPAAAEQKRVMSLKKGQIGLHHSVMVHGSDSNRNSSPRLSLVRHMQDGSIRWRQFLDDQREPWVITNDRLARRTADGTRDYTDPDILPVLWPPSQDRHSAMTRLI